MPGVAGAALNALNNLGSSVVGGFGAERSGGVLDVNNEIFNSEVVGMRDAGKLPMDIDQRKLEEFAENGKKLQEKDLMYRQAAGYAIQGINAMVGIENSRARVAQATHRANERMTKIHRGLEASGVRMAANIGVTNAELRGVKKARITTAAHSLVTM